MRKRRTAPRAIRRTARSRRIAAAATRRRASGDEQPALDEGREDPERGDQPADPGREKRPDPHPEEVVERGRARDLVPLVDRRMNRTLPEANEGESEPKTASWRANHGAIRREQPRRSDRRPRAGSPADHARGAGRVHARQAIPQERQDDAETPPASTPSLRDRVAKPDQEPGRRTAAMPLQPPRREPQRARDERLEEREVVGLHHERGGQGGAMRTPAPTATTRSPRLRARSPRPAARRARR